MDEDLQAAITDNLHMLGKVSSERKWTELSRIFQGIKNIQVVELMKSFGVLPLIIPETNFSAIERFSESPVVNLAILCSRDSRSGTLLADHLQQVLRLSNEEYSTIRFLHDLQSEDLSHEINSFRRFNAALSDSMKKDVMAYFGQKGEEFLEASSKVEPLNAGNKPLIDGEKLMMFTGLEPGIRLGRLKGWLHRRQIEENLSDADEVISLLKTIDWKSEEPGSWPSLAWP